MPTDSDRRLSRRNLVRSAVAIGGAAAFAACTERETMPDLPHGPDDLSQLSARPHAWNEALATDSHGNHRAPSHRVLLYLDLVADGTPNSTKRETVERALRTLERAYPRSHEGLLFTISYSPAYFDRFDTTLHDSVDLPEPEPLAPFEDPELDRPDAVIHLASDYGQVVLAAEEALFGELETLNDVEVEATLEDVFARIDRRTGFVGQGLPADHQDVGGVPDSKPVSEESPLFMGFKSGFKKNQASEDRVTIQEGPFADGTTQHISRIRLNLQQWYEQDSRDQRVAKMFCPVHAQENRVEGAGDNLGESSRLGDCPAHTEEHARTRGVVGHSQKSARARENDSPRIIRQDFNSTDGDHAGLHFVAVQRSIGDFVETRKAMNGTDVAENSAVGQRTNNGILQYISVKRRGNYFVPPRSLRSLPMPEGSPA